MAKIETNLQIKLLQQTADLINFGISRNSFKSPNLHFFLQKQLQNRQPTVIGLITRTQHSIAHHLPMPPDTERLPSPLNSVYHSIDKHTQFMQLCVENKYKGRRNNVSLTLDRLAQLQNVALCRAVAQVQDVKATASKAVMYNFL